MHTIILAVVVIALIFAVGYLYTESSAQLELLAAVQSKIVAMSKSEDVALKDRDQLLTKVKESSSDLKQELLGLIAERDDIIASLRDQDKATAAVITSLTSEFATFKNVMDIASKGSESANSKIVSMSKDIADRVVKSDFDQLKTSVLGKANASDFAKLATSVSAIDSKITTNYVSKDYVANIVASLADKVALESALSEVRKVANDLSIEASSREELSSKIKDILEKVYDTSLSDKVADTINALSTIKAGLDGKADVVVMNSVSAELATVVSQVSNLKTTMNTISAVLDTLKASSASIDTLKTSMTTITDSIKASISSVSDTVKASSASIDTLKTSMTTITDSLKASISSVSDTVNSVKSDVDTLKTSTKMRYQGTPSKTIQPGTKLRFAMVADQGIVSEGAYSNYPGTKTDSISLEQMRLFCQTFDASIAWPVTIWFRSQKDIGAWDNMVLSTSDSYIAALLGWGTLDPANVNMHQVFSSGLGVISGGKSYETTINRSSPDFIYAYRFYARLINRAIQAMIQLSSRLDCAIEFVMDFKTRGLVETVKARDVDVQWKVYKDQSFLNGRYQPRLYANAAIDASNGLIVPHGEYIVPDNSGAVSAKDSKAVCPLNTYMCGMSNSGTAQNIKPMCCSFNPGEWTSYNNQF